MHTTAPEAGHFFVECVEKPIDARTGAIDYFDGCPVPAGGLRAERRPGRRHREHKGSAADEGHAAPRTIGVLCRPIACQAASGGSAYPPAPRGKRPCLELDAA